MSSSSLKPWEQVEQEFSCQHQTTRLTVFTAKNGVTSFRIQCRRCGDTVSYPKKSEVSQSQAITAIPFDDEIQKRWWEARSKRFSEIVARERREKDEAWWSWYNSYLLTSKWLEKRLAVLNRDKWVCQGCLQRRATQVHHLTYKHAGEEFMFELISVCDYCHDRIHDDGSHPLRAEQEGEYEDDEEDSDDEEDEVVPLF